MALITSDYIQLYANIGSTSSSIIRTESVNTLRSNIRMIAAANKLFKPAANYKLKQSGATLPGIKSQLTVGYPPFVRNFVQGAITTADVNGNKSLFTSSRLTCNNTIIAGTKYRVEVDVSSLGINWQPNVEYRFEFSEDFVRDVGVYDAPYINPEISFNYTSNPALQITTTEPTRDLTDTPSSINNTFIEIEFDRVISPEYSTGTIALWESDGTFVTDWALPGQAIFTDRSIRVSTLGKLKAATTYYVTTSGDIRDYDNFGFTLTGTQDFRFTTQTSAAGFPDLISFRFSTAAMTFVYTRLRRNQVNVSAVFDTDVVEEYYKGIVDEIYSSTFEQDSTSSRIRQYESDMLSTITNNAAITYNTGTFNFNVNSLTDIFSIYQRVRNQTSNINSDTNLIEQSIVTKIPIRIEGGRGNYGSLSIFEDKVVGGIYDATVFNIVTEQDVSNVGAAFVFDIEQPLLAFSVEQWPEITASQFGANVANNSQYFYVAAPNLEYLTATGGAISIYSYTGQLVGGIANPNNFGTSNFDRLGSSLVCNEQYLVVGADSEDDSNGTTSGVVYVFTIDGSKLLYTIVNPNAVGTSQSDQFGRRCCLTNDYLVVTATGEDSTGGTPNLGYIYVFNIHNGQLLYNIPNKGSASEEIAVNKNNILAVGDPLSLSGSGSVRLYNLVTGSLIRTVSNPNFYGTTSNDNFGECVALNEKFLFVSAQSEDNINIDGSLNTGKIYVINLQSYDVVYVINGSTVNPLTGNAMAANEKYLVASGPNSLINGKTYVYRISNNTLSSARFNTIFNINCIVN